MCGFKKNEYVQYLSVFSILYDFLDTILFSSLPYCKNTISDNIMYKICVNQLIMLFIT